MPLNKAIVVTGGAGFIGSGAVAALNEQGIDQLVIIDDLGSDEKWKNLVGKSFLEIIPVDSAFSWLETHHKEIGAVLHLGANSSTTETNASYLLERNTHFSQKLCLLALEKGWRFVYASSAATYGDGTNGFSDDLETIERLRPLNMYGYSKHLFDLWAKRHGYFSKIVGLKYFNVFGPNEWHKGRMSSAVLKFFSDIKTKGSVSLFRTNDPKQFGDGEQCRDFIYVKDAVAITLELLANKNIGGLFNVGTGKARTWNALAKASFAALETPIHIEYCPMPDDLTGKYQNFTEANMETLQKALGKPVQTTSLEESVQEYIQHYLLPGTCW